MSMMEASLEPASLRASTRAPSATCLLVDPLRAERRALSDYLRQQGLNVIEADHVDELQDKAGPADVVVVVASLPDASVSAFIRRSAEAGGAPILVMSETGEYVERVLALELGADDLVGREINPRELLARLRGLMRRRDPGPPPPRSVRGEPGWALQADRRALLTPAGRRIDLSPADMALLTAFAEGSNNQIADDHLPGGNLRTAVSRLRQRAMSQAHVDLPIRNVRGLGYRFDAPLLRA